MRNYILCKDYPLIFKGFKFAENSSVFPHYSILPNHVTNREYIYKGIHTGILQVKTRVLRTIRTDYLNTPLIDLQYPYLTDLLKNISKELNITYRHRHPIAGETYLYGISEGNILLNPFTFKPYTTLFLSYVRIPLNYDDGLEILNSSIKSKHWYDYHHKPFYIDNIHDVPVLRFNRCCAKKIYNDSGLVSNLQILDQYLIEIIYGKLKKFKIEKILFAHNPNSSNKSVMRSPLFDKEYIKIGKKWLLKQ